MIVLVVLFVFSFLFITYAIVSIYSVLCFLGVLLHLIHDWKCREFAAVAEIRQLVGEL